MKIKLIESNGKQKADSLDLFGILAVAFVLIGALFIALHQPVLQPQQQNQAHPLIFQGCFRVAGNGTCWDINNSWTARYYQLSRIYWQQKH